ncbi:MAG: hypothetical protein H6Q15_423 [Bacteroidetes bacterium]|nr:hypothetical protein [Bacteroidota bacterium]
MRTYIENILQEKTKDTRANIFYTQWQVAKEYVPQVLNTISHIFPHYSLHDSTHSDTIINNIVRIVGKDVIENFSAIDLWLLLSSAYYHDIGMAVFAKDFDKIFKGDDFKDFLNDVQNDTRSTLHEYANLLLIKDGKIYYKDCEFNSKSYEGSRFLIAEFIRRQHAERSKESIISDISLKLPGDSIPSRIINILSNICLSHGKSFEDVMKIPFSETSIDFEDCHPRYIACLLRLGDLLDLDNNRFSEVILQTLSNIPLDSVLHDKKHRSIEHIRIDKQRIEIKATCEEYEEADITNRWFEFLDAEISNQMKKWNKIVPCVDYGFLPTLGDLKVELKDYDTIDGKLRPSFSIDPQKSIELLQGAGLYREPYQCIREILQNAVDATFLRIYLENKEEISSYTRENFLKDCKKYPISVDIKKNEEKSKNGISVWDITIIDQGIGMSKEDIHFLTTTGSSNKNTEKRKMIENMPEWMKPSGTFGIGFQSVFLITDEVIIETKKINRENKIILDLYNPAGIKNGAVLIKTVKNTFDKIGTTIKFEVVCDDNKLFDDFPYFNYYYYNEYNLKKNLISVKQNFDFIKQKTHNSEIIMVCDELEEFDTACPIDLDLKYESIGKLNHKKDSSFKYFCDKNNLEFNLEFNKTTGCDAHETKVFYRNQIVEDARIFTGFISIQVNILGGNAKEILTLNRNSLQNNYRNKLRKDLAKLVLFQLLDIYETLTDKEKQYSSMFIHYYSIKNNIDIENIDQYSDWEKFEIKLKNEGKIKLGDFFEKSDEIIFFEPKNDDNDDFPSFEIKDNIATISYMHSEILVDFIRKKCINMHLVYNPDINGEKIIVSKKNIELIIKNIEFWFRNYASKLEYARGVMPCEKKYEKLMLRNDFAFQDIIDDTFYMFNIEYPKMICPYIRTNSKYCKKRILKLSYDSLCEFVYENRKEKGTTLKEIEDTYKVFVEDTKKIIRNVNIGRLHIRKKVTHTP